MSCGRSVVADELEVLEDNGEAVGAEADLLDAGEGRWPWGSQAGLKGSAHALRASRWARVFPVALRRRGGARSWSLEAEPILAEGRREAGAERGEGDGVGAAAVTIAVTPGEVARGAAGPRRSRRASSVSAGSGWPPSGGI